MARLKDRYREEIAPALKERFEIQNPMRIPGLEKIVVNMGVGEAVVNSRALDGAVEDLAKITGQKPQIRRARKKGSVRTNKATPHNQGRPSTIAPMRSNSPMAVTAPTVQTSSTISANRLGPRKTSPPLANTHPANSLITRA